MSRNEFTCDCTMVHEEIVCQVRRQMLPETLCQETAVFFKVLGDLTRVKIIAALERHEMCVCDLANLLSMTKSAVSHQLALLRKNGFVSCRRDGKTVFYAPADDHIKQILEIALIHIQE